MDPQAAKALVTIKICFSAAFAVCWLWHFSSSHKDPFGHTLHHIFGPPFPPTNINFDIFYTTFLILTLAVFFKQKVVKRIK